MARTLLIFPNMPHLAQDLVLMRARLDQELVDLVSRAVGRGISAYDWLASYGALAQLAGRLEHLEELLEAWPSRSCADAEVALLHPGDPRPAPPATSKARQSQPVPPLEVIEAEHINRVLVRTGGNMSKAAKALGISRATLYRRLDGMREELRSPMVRAVLSKRRAGDEDETGD